MSSFFIKQGTFFKPVDDLDFDASHPHLDNCIAYVPLIRDLRALNYITGLDSTVIATAGGFPAEIFSKQGRAVKQNGSINQGLIGFNIPQIPLAANESFTCLMGTWIHVFGPDQGVYSLQNDQNPGSWLDVFAGNSAYRMSAFTTYSSYTINTLGYWWGGIVWRQDSSIDFVNYGQIDTASRALSYGANPLLNIFCTIDSAAKGIAGRDLGETQQNTTPLWFYFFRGALSVARIREIGERPFEPFAPKIWVPVSAGTGNFPLNIQDLTHAHPMDAPAVGGNYTLSLGDLAHAHPVDQCAVTLAGAAETLDIDKLTHQHPLDSPILVDGQLLDIDKMSHAHPVDSPTLGLPPIAITIEDLVHAHPVDAPVVSDGWSLTINDLTHAHPVDEVAVAALEGTRTALVGETGSWDADAGVVLSNANGVDITDWHVVEIVFDGVNSILTVDGVEVTGNAGVRALTALTVGAEKDGANRFQGIIGELRIYDGEVDTTTRAQIRAELQQKWITG